jgi:hypothetical protein
VLLTCLLGTIVGLIMAMTGAGGGVLAVPLLIFGLHLTVRQAAPVALLAVGAAASLGALLGLREGIVRYRAAALIGGLGMAMAPLGVWLAHRLPPAPLLIGFAVILGWTAWRMFRLSHETATDPRAGVREQPCRVDPRDGRLRWTPPCALALGSTGIVSGLLSGLLGVGGGFVIVPSLTHHTDLDARSIAATSLAVIAMAAASGVAAASGLGGLDWPLAGVFGGAAVLALWAGRQVVHRLPPAAMQQSFAMVGAAVALLMLARGLGWIAS